jgi:hypothetical protein
VVRNWGLGEVSIYGQGPDWCESPTHTEGKNTHVFLTTCPEEEEVGVMLKTCLQANKKKF